MQVCSSFYAIQTLYINYSNIFKMGTTVTPPETGIPELTVCLDNWSMTMIWICYNEKFMFILPVTIFASKFEEAVCTPAMTALQLLSYNIGTVSGSDTGTVTGSEVKTVVVSTSNKCSGTNVSLSFSGKGSEDKTEGPEATWSKIVLIGRGSLFTTCAVSLVRLEGEIQASKQSSSIAS